MEVMFFLLHWREATQSTRTWHDYPWSWVSLTGSLYVIMYVWSFFAAVSGQATSKATVLRLSSLLCWQLGSIAPGEVLPEKLGWGSVARFLKPSPFLWPKSAILPSLILFPKGRAPFGQHQESRPPGQGRSNTGSSRLIDHHSAHAQRQVWQIWLAEDTKRVLLNLSRGCDSWCWTKTKVQPLGTRMHYPIYDLIKNSNLSYDFTVKSTPEL